MSLTSEQKTDLAISILELSISLAGTALEALRVEDPAAMAKVRDRLGENTIKAELLRQRVIAASPADTD